MTPDTVMPMHQTSIDTVEDMSQLGDLHEAAILYNIQQRYTHDKIYVSKYTWDFVHVYRGACVYVCVSV